MTRDDQRAEITRRTAALDEACADLIRRAAPLTPALVQAIARAAVRAEAAFAASAARIDAGLIGVQARLTRQQRRARRRLHG